MTFSLLSSEPTPVSFRSSTISLSRPAIAAWPSSPPAASPAYPSSAFPSYISSGSSASNVSSNLERRRGGRQHINTNLPAIGSDSSQVVGRVLVVALGQFVPGVGQILPDA